MKTLLLLTFLIKISLLSIAQSSISIDNDILLLINLSENKIVLDSIIRGNVNEDAIWIQYDRRPGVDPWIDRNKYPMSYTEEHFIQFFNREGIKILGAINTFDNCGCTKTRSMGSPDMTLINFKISLTDWKKLIVFYPNIGDSEIISRKKSR